MEYKKFDNKYIVRIDKNEEVIEKLTELCEKENIKLWNINWIWATNYVQIGLFDTEKKAYNSTILEWPMEITSLMWNISAMNNEVYLHLHINISNKNMEVFWGHLNQCKVSATCEIIIDKIDGEIQREFNEEIWLNLYKF